MREFEIDCVDTKTFKNYTMAVAAETLEEARELAAKDGHKVNLHIRSLNPQLVPPSMQVPVPGEMEDGRSWATYIAETSAGRSRRNPVVVFVIVLILLLLIGLAIFWRIRSRTGH